MLVFELDYMSLPLEQRQAHIRLDESCIEFDIQGRGHSHAARAVLAIHLKSGLPNVPKSYGIHCCHACNNKQCFNPKHLYWGTAAENVHDQIVAGTKYTHNKGWHHDDEAKRKVSVANKGNKACLGTWLLTDGVHNKRVKAGAEIPVGWRRGVTKNWKVTNWTIVNGKRVWS